MTLLQINGWSLLAIFEIGLLIITVILGLAIGYQAYQGYRRNDSVAMLFIGIGLVLVASLPVPVLYLSVLVFNFNSTALASLSQIVGLLCIVYALFVAD